MGEQFEGGCKICGEAHSTGACQEAKTERGGTLKVQDSIHEELEAAVEHLKSTETQADLRRPMNTPLGHELKDYEERLIPEARQQAKEVALKTIETLGQSVDVDVTELGGEKMNELIYESDLSNSLDLLGEGTDLDQGTVDKVFDLQNKIGDKIEEQRRTHTIGWGEGHPLAIRRELILKKLQELEVKGLVKFNEENKKLEVIKK